MIIAWTNRLSRLHAGDCASLPRGMNAKAVGVRNSDEVRLRPAGLGRTLLTGLGAVLATPIAFVLPSRERHVSAAKVTVLALAVTAFFLFTGMYSFPGGAGQFTSFAEAIVQGHKLPPSIAQRDAGYPMLLVLSGWTVWHSFIGITLVQATFAVLMPLLVYWSVVRIAPTVAYYAAIASVVSFGPILFMKWIHHDQTYIFFMLLVVALLATFLQTRAYKYLYMFTAAAVVASFTRPAGNLLFPILLVVAYLTGQRRVIHYVVCISIVVVAAFAYSWYRYDIFDMAHQSSTPSYTGEQVFYNLYINSGDFGIRISPNLGPALQEITNTLRQKLQPDPLHSPYLRPLLSEEPAAFIDEAIAPYTADELIDEIYEAPNWEYYVVLASAADDRLYVDASLEIAEAHPWYVVQYVGRNVWHMLFRPGFAHTRYTINERFHPIGLAFLPGGANSGGIDELGGGIRGKAELTYAPIKEAPNGIQVAFGTAAAFWLQSFRGFVLWTSVLMVAGWVFVILRLVAFVLPRRLLPKVLAGPTTTATVACTIGASAFLLYNALVTAAFAEPDYRYFLFTELLRVLVAGYGLALVQQVVCSVRLAYLPEWRASRTMRAASGAVVRLRSADALARLFRSEPVLLAMFVGALVAIAFASWAGFMIGRT